MKTKLPLIAALCCGLSPIGSAFTLDFTGLSIGTMTPFTINVPGYGDVDFSPNTGSLAIEVFEPGASNAIAFDINESISINFKGAVPIDVRNQYIGVNAGESFIFDFAGADPRNFILTLAGRDNVAKAGLQSVVFEQVPEPASSIMGVIGAALLVLRRKR